MKSQGSQGQALKDIFLRVEADKDIIVQLEIQISKSIKGRNAHRIGDNR
jgi:hypothetical protein